MGDEWEHNDKDLMALIAANLRDFQDYWAWKNKPIAEQGAVSAVLQALGLSFEKVGIGEDPPDCWVEFEGQRVSVEHTELVAQEALKATFRTGELHYRRWSEPEFVAELGERIAKKAAKLERYSSEYAENWLLIVTDEFELDELRVSEWLSRNAFDLGGFTKVVFALSYHPSPDGGHIPVFSLEPA